MLIKSFDVIYFCEYFLITQLKTWRTVTCISLLYKFREVKKALNVLKKRYESQVFFLYACVYTTLRIVYLLFNMLDLF